MIRPALRRVALVALLAVLLAAVPVAAQARFIRTTNAVPVAVSTDTLAAPSGINVTRQCGILNPNVQVSWPVAADDYATGYTVTMTRTATGATSTMTVSGRTTTSLTVSIGFYSAVTFTVTSTYRGWTSTQTASTPAVQCGLIG